MLGIELGTLLQTKQVLYADQQFLLLPISSYPLVHFVKSDWQGLARVSSEATVVGLQQMVSCNGSTPVVLLPVVLVRV